MSLANARRKITVKAVDCNNIMSPCLSISLLQEIRTAAIRTLTALVHMECSPRYFAQSNPFYSENGKAFSEYCIWSRFTRSLCHCFAPFLLVFWQSAD